MVKFMFMFIAALATFFMYISLGEGVATSGDLSDGLFMIAPMVISYIGYRTLNPIKPSIH